MKLPQLKLSPPPSPKEERARGEEVKERPILFSGDMVRALRAGRKTQTRRIINCSRLKVRLPEMVKSDAILSLIPSHRPTVCQAGIYPAKMNAVGAVSVQAKDGRWLGVKPGEFHFVSPFCDGDTYLRDYGHGKKCWTITPTGCRLWVKETHARLHDGLLAHLDPEPDNGTAFNNGWRTAYRADGLPADWENYGLKWKPSIFMRRQFSRINLEITGIRVERLQDISEEDSIAEGIKWFSKDGNLKKYWPCDFCDGDLKRAWSDLPRTAKEAYRALWNWLNLDPSPIYKTWHHPGLSKAEDSKSKEIESYQCFPWSNENFDAAYPGIRARGIYRGKPISVTPNPWVWVIEFRRIES